MARTFLLMDSLNLFYRSVNVTRGTVDLRAGMAMHICLNSILVLTKMFKADHVAWAMEGKSWRKGIDTAYKANRLERFSKLSPREQQDNEILLGMYGEMMAFIRDKTNCSVLVGPGCEADDMIAGWIQAHPDDFHIIVSSDSDFQQLLNANTVIYDGMAQKMLVAPSFVNQDIVKPAAGLKVEVVEDPEYFLFKKCIRGDSSDNIFSAYPGVREKGSKNKVGIIEAFADREARGFAWNTFMQSQWKTPEGETVLVKDAYERNLGLIDLTRQPDEVKQMMAEAIGGQMMAQPVDRVGFNLMKFCSHHALNRLKENTTLLGGILNAGYN